MAQFHSCSPEFFWELREQGDDLPISDFPLRKKLADYGVAMGMFMGQRADCRLHTGQEEEKSFSPWQEAQATNLSDNE